MSTHITYRGATIDMDSIRRENEHVLAIGNQSVNARGDQIKGGMVTKTADQIARENHRVQSVIINSGLKGPLPSALAAPTPLSKPSKTRTKEKELPSGDILIESEKDES